MDKTIILTGEQVLGLDYLLNKECMRLEIALQHFDDPDFQKDCKQRIDFIHSCLEKICG